jgi:transposase
VFPTDAHLVSWSKIAPRTVQSAANSRPGKTGKGNRYLKSALGEAAVSAARTNTFLGARYRRVARRIGKQKAQVAVARSILVIVWHLLADPTSRYCDLGPDFFDTRITPERRKQNHIHQLEALGYKVTLEPAA